MTLFEEVYSGACLLCGGLAQGMSDEAAIRYAAFWSGRPASKIKKWAEIAYPDGTEQERVWLSDTLRSRKLDMDSIFNIIDDYVKRNGFTSEGRRTMVAGTILYLHEKYGGRNYPYNFNYYMNDRFNCHHERQQMGRLKLIGYGRPISIEPSHLAKATEMAS